MHGGRAISMVDVHTFIAQNLQKYLFQSSLVHFPLHKCVIYHPLTGKICYICHILIENGGYMTGYMLTSLQSTF